MIKRLGNRQNAKQFLINNIQGILKCYNQPYFLSTLSVIIYYISICGVLIDEELLDSYKGTDLKMNLLREIILFRKSTSTVYVGIGIGCINYTFLLGLVSYYMMYSYKPFSNKQVVLMSVFFQNYKYLVFIPFSYYSLESNTFLGYTNSIVTLAICLVSSKFGTKLKFRISDHLSKRYTFLDTIIVLLIFLCILLKIHSSNTLSLVFMIGIQLLSAYEIWNYLPFLDQRIGILNLQFCFISSLWNILFVVSINLKWNGYVICLFTVAVLILKGSAILYEKRLKRISQIFVFNTNNNTQFYRNLKPHYIDIYVRSFILSDIKLAPQNYLHGNEQAFVESIVIEHIQNCQKRPYCFCSSNEESKNNRSNKVMEYLIGNSLRVQIIQNYVMNIYDEYFSKQKQFDETNISYLYFIYEITQNQCLVFNKIMEFLKKPTYNISIENQSILLEIHNKVINKRKINSINQVIEFDDQLQVLYQQLIEMIDKKNKFLKVISSDHIYLTELERLGDKFIEEREELIKLFHSMHQKNKSSYFLQLLIQTFLATLSFNDSRYVVQSFILNFLSNQNSDLLSSMNQFISIIIKRLWFQKVMKIHSSYKYASNDIKQLSELLFSKKSVAVFVSIYKDNFGSILNVSKNIETTFGYTKDEVKDKNCNILLTQNLASFHDNLIYRFLNRGQLQDNFIYRLNPLMGMTKSRYIVPLTMKLQIGQAGTEDIGISSLITVNPSLHDNYIVLDIYSYDFTLRIDAFTKNIFNRLFQPIFRFDNHANYNQISGSRIFPLLPFAIKIISDKNKLNPTINSQFIEMIGFFPLESQEIVIKKRDQQKQKQQHSCKLDEYRSRLQRKIIKQKFSLEKNQVFMFQLNLQYLREENHEHCQISINSYTEISLQDFQRNTIKMELQQQFQNLGDLYFDFDEIEQLFEINNMNDTRIFTTHYGSTNFRNTISMFNERMMPKEHSINELSQLDEQLFNIQRQNSSFQAFSRSKTIQAKFEKKNGSHQYIAQNSINNSTNKYNQISYSNMGNSSKRQKQSNNLFLSNEQIDEGNEIEDKDEHNVSLELHHFDKDLSQQQIEDPFPSSLHFKINSSHNINSPMNQNKQGEKQFYNTSNFGSNRLIALSNQHISLNSPTSSEFNQIKSTEHLILPKNIDQSINKNSDLNIIKNTEFNILKSTDTQYLKSTDVNVLSSQSLMKSQSQLIEVKSSKQIQSQYFKQLKDMKEKSVYSKKRKSTYFKANQKTMGQISHISVQESQSSSSINLSKELESIQNISLSSQSKSSYDKSLRKMVIYSIQKNKILLPFVLVKVLSLLSLIAIGSVMLAKYFDLRDQFNKQIYDFKYIPWAMETRVTISRALKDGSLRNLMQHEIFENSINDKENLKQQLSNNMSKLSQYYQKLIVNVFNEKREILLLEYLNSKQVTLKFFTSINNFIQISMKTLYAILMHNQQLFYYALSDSDSLIAEAFLFQNFTPQASTLAEIQKTQELSVSDSFIYIENEVESLLIMSSVFSGLFIICSFLSYIYSQNYKSQILELLATIDPAKLLEMNHILIQSAQILYSENSRAILKQGYSKSKTKFQKQTIIPTLSRKKKLIQPTTSLPKFSFRVYSTCFFILILLLIYPITNLILTRSLINQSNSNQSLQGNFQFFQFLSFFKPAKIQNRQLQIPQYLRVINISGEKINKIKIINFKTIKILGIIQTSKAQISSNIASYSLYLVSQLYSNLKVTEIKLYRDRFYKVISDNSSILSKLQFEITQQKELSRYKKDIFDQFLFQSMEKDSCEIFKQYYNVYNKSDKQFNYQKCKQIQNGILKSGLITSIRTFVDFFNQIWQFDQITDEQQRFNLIKQYFSRVNLFELNECYEIIVDMLNALSEFIFEINEEFIQQMNDIQTALMIYQFIILILTFKYIGFYYFEELQHSIYKSKQSLSILEVKYLYENSYIINYLKR